MSSAPRLRAHAQEQRDRAADLRRIGPTLSLADHRELMARHAAELEADARRLDAEADADEDSAPGKPA
jgi:hypothetical protein